MMRVVTGTAKPVSARIRLDGRDITTLPTHQRARLGLQAGPKA